jgi:hypothetical protein
MSGAPLRDEINKRLTLNWLIQGAAQHAGMTFHHLVRDELDALDPRLVRLYDQYAICNLLQYWGMGAAVLVGWPSRFWKRANEDPDHPFFGHPLLATFGGMLANAGRQRALQRCHEKGLTRLGFVREYQAAFVARSLREREDPHRARLMELAKQSASTIWGIPMDRLQGTMGPPKPFGTPIRVRTTRGAVLRAAAVGLGGVARNGEALCVVGMGANWQLLTKELVKGTAEMICLHGLSDLSEDTYRDVMDAADRIELEPRMLQTGGELWRRVLAALPEGQPIAEALMHMARLPADALQAFVKAAITGAAGVPEARAVDRV